MGFNSGLKGLILPLTGHAALFSSLHSAINYYEILNKQILNSKPLVPLLFARHN